MKNIINKKGNVSNILTITISLVLLLIFGIYIINLLIPFMWYQKLDNISSKYVYVIEKFGCLTDKEEKKLYEDLKNEGFDTNKVVLDYPKSNLEYGTLFKFEISYYLEQNYSIIANGIKNEARTVPLHIKKYSYSKM